MKLQAEEIENSEVQIIRKAQEESFSNEYMALISGRDLPKNSKLLSFRPKLDEDNVMLYDGRLKQAEFLSYNVRHPVLLPRKHSVTRLIVKHYQKHMSGINQILSALSARFWIIAGREEKRDWEKVYQMSSAKSKDYKSDNGTTPRQSISAITDFFISCSGLKRPFKAGENKGRSHICVFLCAYRDMLFI